MELLLFTLNGIIVYLVSDRIVRAIERRRGEVLEQRQAVFFVIFLVLILASFQGLKALRASQSETPAKPVQSDAQLPVQPRIEGREVTGEPFSQPTGELLPT